MKIGFTGTREGMTDAQKVSVKEVLQMLEVTKGHHGDCVGADSDFHDICRTLGIRIKGHPPIDPKLRAYKECDELATEKKYFARNRDIVNETDLLIATPKESAEQPSGGTWYTIGYGITTKSSYIIVWPDGSVKTIIS